MHVLMELTAIYKEKRKHTCTLRGRGVVICRPGAPLKLVRHGMWTSYVCDKCGYASNDDEVLFARIIASPVLHAPGDKVALVKYPYTEHTIITHKDPKNLSLVDRPHDHSYLLDNARWYYQYELKGKS